VLSVGKERLTLRHEALAAAIRTLPVTLLAIRKVVGMTDLK